MLPAVLVAWDKVCKPKKFGGLGLRKTGVVNTAFLAKLSWKFLTQPDNLWVKQMRAKYEGLVFSNGTKTVSFLGLEMFALTTTLCYPRTAMSIR